MRNLSFDRVFKSKTVDWNGGLGKLCCRLDIVTMSLRLLFLGGGGGPEESSVRGFCARLADICCQWPKYSVYNWALSLGS